MARNDYYRPADYQVMVYYRCDTCGVQTQAESCYAPGACCGAPLVAAHTLRDIVDALSDR